MSQQLPVIIIGMHRSGTSLLTRTLRELGFFMGADANRNDESAYFNAINAWLFRQASATWDRPEGVAGLLDDEQLLPLLRDYVNGILHGPSAWRFIGWRRGLLAWRTLAEIAAPWGWKDPRNTFTLPLWLSLYPEAKVLHIYRHGVDVAQSLRLRSEQACEASRRRYSRRRRLSWLNPLAPKSSGFAHQPGVRQLAGGFDLWQRYVGLAQRHVAALGERAFGIKYETLLSDPDTQLQRIVAFCGVPARDQRVIAAARQFRPERAYAFRKHPELASFADQHRGQLTAFGY